MPGDHPLSENGSTLAILDANVLLPPRLSDILFDLHLDGLYNPRWTKKIEDEFIRNFGRLVLSKSRAERSTVASAPPDDRQIQAANHRLRCFRAAVGPVYELLRYDQADYINKVPPKVDSGDIHVVSAALVALDYAQQFDHDDKVYIVSNNLKHLAVKDVGALGITVLSPGKFIDALFAIASDRVEQALLKSVSDLSSPAITRTELLGILRGHKALLTAAACAGKWQI